jgi:hypothetical protein
MKARRPAVSSGNGGADPLPARGTGRGPVRRLLKERLYREVVSRARGPRDPAQDAHLFSLLGHLSDLEREDGPGRLLRLLAGIPPDLALAIRQEMRRRLDQGEAGRAGAQRRPVRGRD